MAVSSPGAAIRAVGITGGSGSGKSWLVAELARGLGESAVVLCQDWYYRDRAEISEEEALHLNFDHPGAIEVSRFVQDLKALKAGETVQTPRYDYATHRRVKHAVEVKPAPVILVDGLFLCHEPCVRALLDLTVYVDVPEELRLQRRLTRDATERGIAAAETMRLYERFVRPMHDRFIDPSRQHAKLVWRAAEDPDFPQRLLGQLASKK